MVTAYSVESALFSEVMEKYLKYRWSDHVPTLGEPPKGLGPMPFQQPLMIVCQLASSSVQGPHAIAAMRLLCMAQACAFEQQSFRLG